MRRTMAGAMLALGLLVVRDAGAKDMNGRWGVGAAQTLSGVRGADFTYWAGRLALTGTINLWLGFPEDDDAFFKPDIAIGAFFPLLANDQAELSLGGRASFAKAHDDNQLALEVPLRIEWYPTDHVSFHGEVGVVFESVPKSRILNSAGGSPAYDGTGIIIGGTLLAAGVGFSFYF